jgi:SAM-dependent methyltransferase
MKQNKEELYYGYRLCIFTGFGLVGIGIVGIVLAIAFTLLEYSTWILVLCWALGTILLSVGVFWRLSTAAITDPASLKVFTDNFTELLKNIWDGKGKVLDIGTGRGRLAVLVAKEFPEAQVTGADIWTKMWHLFGLTKAGAEKNAMIANVSNRCVFQVGNALNLPFEDGAFALVLSSFVFHEIHVPDRTVLIKEAVRVLAPGGTFVICDPIRLKSYQVKDVSGLLQKVRKLGVDDVKLTTWKEAGLEVGRLCDIWGFAFLSGRKKDNQE